MFGWGKLLRSAQLYFLLFILYAVIRDLRENDFVGSTFLIFKVLMKSGIFIIILGLIFYLIKDKSIYKRNYSIKNYYIIIILAFAGTVFLFEFLLLR